MHRKERAVHELNNKPLLRHAALKSGPVGKANRPAFCLESVFWFISRMRVWLPKLFSEDAI